MNTKRIKDRLDDDGVEAHSLTGLQAGCSTAKRAAQKLVSNDAAV